VHSITQQRHSVREIIFKTSLSPKVKEFVSAAIAPATRRAYQGDLKDFFSWGGCVPCPPDTVAEYIASRALIHSPFTIARRVVGISRAHTSLDLPDPSKSDLVRAVLRGLRRSEGKPQRQVAPVLREDLFLMLDQMRGIKGTRDRALLLVGFAAALRRSELVGVNVEDLLFCKEGVLVNLPRSKTDQVGDGRKIAIPFGRTSACPVKAVIRWMEVAAINTGAVFRSINKAGVVSPSRLTDQSVALIVKDYARALGLPADAYSGHSLRAGLVTSAAKAGVSLVKIQQQTGHRSVSMLTRYIRDAQVFENNAAGLLL
jgi:site-specific recombinase XerD